LTLQSIVWVPVPYMTYNVFGGTLNINQPNLFTDRPSMLKEVSKMWEA